MKRLLGSNTPSLFRQLACIAATLFVSTAGCGDDAPGDRDASLIDALAPNVDAAATSDASTASDAAPGADAGSPSPVTFRLSYDPPPGPPSSIYVEIACSQMWVSVLDSAEQHIPIDSDCGLCRCDQCDSCAVCDCALLIEPIAAGASRDHAWNGVAHPTRTQDGCGVCSFDRPLEPGTYTARFCYSHSESGARTCGDETFTHPGTAVVEHVVTSSGP